MIGARKLPLARRVDPGDTRSGGGGRWLLPRGGIGFGFRRLTSQGLEYS